MFAPWGASIGGVNDHANTERVPPRRPVKPEFPTYIPPFSPHVLDATHSSRIRERLCRIRSPSSVSEEDLVAFNIDLAHDVDPSDMLPKYTFVTRPLPFDEDLEEMLNELSVDNHDAYREVLRMEPLPGRRKPRLAYARNFFGSLEDIARYWDTSLDEYYERSIAEAETAGHLHGRQLRPSQQTQSSASPSTMDEVGHIDSGTNQRSKPVGNEARNAEQNTTEFYKGYRFGNGEQMNSGTRVAMVKNFLKMVTHKFMCRDYEPMPNPRERLCIRGVKIQAIQYQFCIAALPSDTKLARARVVEGPILAVHCRDELRYENSRPRASAEMEVAESLTADIERLATKQPANNINNLRVASVGEAFDVFREIGCMLILAQRRSREGKQKETLSGADKWWVSEKRFGGGAMPWGQLASEVFEDDDPSWSPSERLLQEEKRKSSELIDGGVKHKQFLSDTDIEALMATSAPIIPASPGDPITHSPRRKKLRSLDRPAGKAEEFKDGRRLMYMPPFKKKWYQEWQKLRPNAPVWDDKIVYKRIGTEGDAAFDEIYMLSSVNHHIALVKMKVHPDYLAWLESGDEVKAEVIDGSRKDVLHVQRSKWYDMFEKEARKELLVCLWRLMCWMTRKSVTSKYVEAFKKPKQKE